MSVDIAMLLEMDHLHPNMGSSPTRTSYPSPLNASSRLFVPVGSSPGHMVASSVMRTEERNLQTPVAATRIRLTGNVAGPSQYRTPQNLGMNSHHPLNRGTMKFSSSPRQGPAITVTSANVSTPPPPIVHSASFSFPRASTVSVVHEAELDGVAGLSPAGFNDDLHWQMYLTASLSNPLNTLNFEEDQPSHLELQYPTTLDGSSSLAAPSRDPFDVFGSSPYMTKMASSRKLDVDRRECNQSSTNDQTLPIPNGTYAALMELTPPTFEFGSARFSSLEASVPRQNPSPLSSVPSPLPRGRSLTISRRGLSGWENDANHANPVQVSSVLQGPHNGRKRRRSTPTSPIPPRRAYKPSSAISSRVKVDARDDCAATTASPLALSLSNSSNSKKMMDRQSPFKQSELGFDSDNENVGLPSEDDADSDDYHPSRSVSPVLPFSRPSSLAAQSSLKRVHDSTRGDRFDEMNRLVPKKKTRRGKGKAKGSAALALAVVTQLGAKSRSLSLGVEDGDDEDNQEFDALALYRQGKTGIRKRKNHPIPLPVPVPNLNKKSRGRKVPYVADVDSVNSLSLSRSQSVLSASSNYLSIKDELLEDAKAELDGMSAAEDLVPKSKRPRRKNGNTVSGSQKNADELSGARSYVCVVPGCGKCFVRGEHLKRHVRSIHTHDKPHPCPYDGCDKSFSRRDNLGQHVRIHLQL